LIMASANALPRRRGAGGEDTSTSST
jgi:hypothetical protein